MKKEVYEKPVMQITEFEGQDVITLSGCPAFCVAETERD